MTNNDHTLATGSSCICLPQAFGTFFAIIPIVLFIVSDRSTSPLLAAVGLGLLGIDAVVSAYRNTRSLSSSVGPLP